MTIYHELILKFIYKIRTSSLQKTRRNDNLPASSALCHRDPSLRKPPAETSDSPDVPSARTRPRAASRRRISRLLASVRSESAKWVTHARAPDSGALMQDAEERRFRKPASLTKSRDFSARN